MLPRGVDDFLRAILMQPALRTLGGAAATSKSCQSDNFVVMNP